MSVQAMTWAFDQAIPPGPKIVLLAIADRTWGKEGQWTIDWRELVQRCSLSRRAIRRYLTILAENGLISLAARYDRNSGVQLSNLCVIHAHVTISSITDWVNSSDDDHIRPGEGTNSGHLPIDGQVAMDGRVGDQPRPGEGTNSGHPLNLNLNSSSSSSQSVPETSKNVLAQAENSPPERETEGGSKHNAESYWVRFWSDYPHRNGKKLEQAATKAIFLFLSIENQPLAAAAARNYAKALKASGLNAKDPKRFLRDGEGHEPWRDWIEPALGPSASRPPPYPPKIDPIARGQWKTVYGDPKKYGYV